LLKAVPKSNEARGPPPSALFIEIGLEGNPVPNNYSRIQENIFFVIIITIAFHKLSFFMSFINLISLSSLFSSSTRLVLDKSPV